MRRLVLLLPRQYAREVRHRFHPSLLRRPLGTTGYSTKRVINNSLVIAAATASSSSNREHIKRACWVAAMMLVAGGGAVAGLENYIETDNNENTTANVAEYKVSKD